MRNITELHKLFLESSAVCTDTRSITDNCMFFALKGANFDGNKFAKKAIKDGARLAVVDDLSLGENPNFFYVNDVLEMLQELANHHRRWLGIPIIGITGTNGKTTTKELVNAVLSKKYNAFATKGNFNNHIGVPLTLLMMDKSVEIGIVEMGANHLGEIAALCKIAEPNYGLITNVGKAHLEGFGSFEGVKKTKSELYRHIEKNSDILFVNSNNSHLQSMLGVGAQIIGFGNDRNDRVSCTTLSKDAKLSFVARVNSEFLSVSTQLIGVYNLENALAAIAIGHYFKVPIVEIANALEEYVPSNNRSQLLSTKTNKVLLDAYNANPSSMQVALSNFANIEDGNKVLILGEMKELGGTSSEEHRKIIDLIISHQFQNVILLGDNYTEFADKIKNMLLCSTLKELKDYLQKHPIRNAFVLVKGSRSNKLESIVGCL